MLLLGRDIIEVHHVLDQRIGQGNQPYAQKLRLGWTVIGETCLGKTHATSVINTNKTHLLSSGRVSLFPPCTNDFKIRESLNDRESAGAMESLTVRSESDEFGKVFQRTKDDEKPGMSVEDRDFLRIMDAEFTKDSDGSWSAPLPFREGRSKLPNNRALALKRAKSLHGNLQRDNVKRQHFVSFMEEILKNGHAEKAPALVDNEECWYLPTFGVYHPKKPDQLRAVFDSSAKFEGVSLNDVLLTGHDFTNSLLGVLLRFRREPVAIMGDIKQMFYGFKVREDHRNLLRFFWYQDNDPEQNMVEYRMTVHVFGNSPSPAIATYGLRKSAENAEATFGRDVTSFVERDFYVDDGLTCLPTVPEAVSLMKRTQKALMTEGNLRLHKIASNHEDVMRAFPSEDLAKNMKELDLNKDLLPTQHSLGLNWDCESDTFYYVDTTGAKPYTRRGVLSSISSIFDPIGFLAPVVVEGKGLLRYLIHGTVDWDEPLPAHHLVEWERWKDSLVHLEGIRIPRTYIPGSLSECKEKSVHVFSDASETAIAAVGYLRTTMQNDERHLGFLLGKGKLAPIHGHSIPRLELCAAVLAVELANTVSDQLDLPIEEFRFYTDSKVVLGYIYNRSRRFYTYVTNRVSLIRKITKPEQWSYVPTGKNPADQATREVPAYHLKDSVWLLGPPHLLNCDEGPEDQFGILDPETDKEVRPEVLCLKTHAQFSSLGSQRFSRFSTWKGLVEAIAKLKHVANSFRSEQRCTGWHSCDKTVDAYQEAEKLIIKTVQQEFYQDEFECALHNKPLPRTSPLLSLNVFLDKDGLLRVGGRLRRSSIHINEKNPILVPYRHHIAVLLVRHHHEAIKHQGRHLTAGAIRSAGFWITGGNRLVSSILFKCVKCKKLRGRLECQKMADLPSDRLEPGPPFSYVGLDTFGPWPVVTRRTRGGSANSKRWAILFTCLTTRGIHIEVVEELSSSSFINAFKRFTAIRGKVKQIRSDRGTNFVGATDDLQIDAINVEDGPVKDHLYQNGTTWLFNTPHSSHMGGVWERMIGVTRRILDSMMSEIAPGCLTHEVLTTFLAEASAIVNASPLVPVSSDSDDPIPLSPSMILTQKPDSLEVDLPIDDRNMYRAQWKRVQHLSNVFWNRWRAQFLQTLQVRRKWQNEQRNVATGDVVLLKDNTTARNYWPMGVVTSVYPSDDGRVRKAEIRVVHRDSAVSVYTRPVTEMVVLLSED